MSSSSDITINTEAFNADRIDPSTAALNTYVVGSAGQAGVKWHDAEVGAAKFRALQDEGKTSWPAPAKLAHGEYTFLPSREAGREIKCRVFKPQEGNSRGVFLHFHGGGHVLGHCDWQDRNLDSFANGAGLTVVSVEYRLAPEHPFPAGNEDCYDIAEYLVDNPFSQASGPLKFVGGESAGASLAALTVLHLLEKRPAFSFAGVCLTYGIFDLSLLPSARTWTNPLITDTDAVQHYFDAYLPNHSLDERRHPSVSPIYHPIFQYRGSVRASEDTYKPGKPQLPPALFLTGTHDLVLDDMVLMHFKWQLAGGEARIKFVEGAPHAFLLVPAQQFKIVGQGEAVIIDFLKEKL